MVKLIRLEYSLCLMSSIHCETAEYGYSLRITEKSDGWSQQITGFQRVHTLSSYEIRVKKRDFTSILDQNLIVQCGTRIPEMLQILGVAALLCVNPYQKKGLPRKM
ncbi:hypothetical protein Ahy_B03g067469 isoform A [Arachis hypogaea]|uniref:Uncharacterized protein n=1 Tax=Arachis hypogaea TaxID=3818 RepID=A0A445A6W4_ARAHY|nr:hypothetical protein Ahy_B03g067469 isoform A [Arachis hypogaea]